MFNLLSNSPLSDVLAPRLSPLEEFITQWDSFTSFFNENRHESRQLCKCLIESTNLSNKLSKMCDILVEEQADFVATNDQAGICPSVEFALQNKALETLSVLAQADAPLGISPRIMLFFNRLLAECKTDLIPQKCVYTALGKLIAICAKVPAGPYEPIESTFLANLTEKIYRYPAFLNFFLDDSFPLINSLLSLLCSPDSDIVKRAGDAIIKLICICDENAERIIVERTPFCSKIINQIIAHYDDIPRSLNPQEVETAIYTFRNNDSCHSTFTNSVRKFLCFLKWFIFFDMLIYHSPKSSTLISTLLSQFKLEFLEATIMPDLTGDGFEDEMDSIDNIFLTTVLLSNCLRNTESFVLHDFIAEFFTIPDSVDPNVVNKYKNHELLPTLLKRCSVSGDESGDDENRKHKTIKLASATLQLFEDILSRPSREVIDHLIVNHLHDRQYLNGPHHKDECADNFESIFQKQDMNEALSELQAVAKQLSSTPFVDAFASAPFVEPNKLTAILYYFTSLIPSELKFNPENEGSDYAAYLKEAINGEQIFLTSCYVHWTDRNSPKSIVDKVDKLSLQDNVEDCRHYEGDFLHMIFDNLNSMATMPYEINLQIFSLIAKISLLPDDNINEFLLDPTITMNASCRSLFSILYKLVEELQIAVKGIDELQQRLQSTKKLLLHEEINSTGQKYVSDNEPINKVLQSLIVLDEFFKELACIVFAKNQILYLCNQKFCHPSNDDPKSEKQ